MGLARAAAAIGGGELDLDHLVLPVVDGRRPTDTVLSLGADGLLMLPINEELAGIDTLLRVSLPLDVAASRTDYFDPVLRLSADQNGGGDVAGIEQMLTGCEICLPKIRMDRFGHDLIGGGSSAGSHMRDEVRSIVLTGFGEMHFVARPPCLALFPIAGLLIVG